MPSGVWQTRAGKIEIRFRHGRATPEGRKVEANLLAVLLSFPAVLHHTMLSRRYRTIEVRYSKALLSTADGRT